MPRRPIPISTATELERKGSRLSPPGRGQQLQEQGTRGGAGWVRGGVRSRRGSLTTRSAPFEPDRSSACLLTPTRTY
eukprot:6175021-Pleurochrysis_carterae.AAC.1